MMKAHDCKTDIDGAHVGYDDFLLWQAVKPITKLKIKHFKPCPLLKT